MVRLKLRWNVYNCNSVFQEVSCKSYLTVLLRLLQLKLHNLNRCGQPGEFCLGTAPPSFFLSPFFPWGRSFSFLLEKSVAGLREVRVALLLDERGYSPVDEQRSDFNTVLINSVSDLRLSESEPSPWRTRFYQTASKTAEETAIILQRWVLFLVTSLR